MSEEGLWAASIIAVLLLLNGYFVAAEFAIAAAPGPQLARLAERGSTVAQRVLAVLRTPRLLNEYISTAQVGITIASLGLGMYGEHTVAALLLPPLEHWGWLGVAAAHDEGVLHRAIPDTLGMQKQLAHLVNVSTRPNVSVRVIPFSAGPHTAASSGQFTVLEFPAVGTASPEPTTIYCENLTGALYLDKLTEVETYESIWAELDATALSQAESDDLIGATAGLFFGLLSAYMYTRSAEDDLSEQKLGHRITSGEMLGLGLAGLAMMRQVAELGKGKEDKSKKRK